MDHATIAYVLTWVGTGAWVICFWWMHRISSRQDALLRELKDLAKTQHDILREVHPDVGEIREHVVEVQGEQIGEIAERVTEMAEVVVASEAGGGVASTSHPAHQGPRRRGPSREDRQSRSPTAPCGSPGSGRRQDLAYAEGVGQAGEEEASA